MFLSRFHFASSDDVSCRQRDPIGSLVVNGDRRFAKEKRVWQKFWPEIANWQWREAKDFSDDRNRCGMLREEWSEGGGGKVILFE